MEKLFVSVPFDKVDGFLTKYVTGSPEVKFTQEEIDAAKEGDPAYGKTTADVKTAAVARDNSYDNKVVFLGNTGQIFAKNNLYGAKGSDVTEIKAILNGFGTDKDDPNKTVADAILAAKKAVLGTTVGIDTTADDYKTGTVAGLNTRIGAIETLINDNTGTYISAEAYENLSDEEKDKYSLVEEEGEHKGQYYAEDIDIIDRLSEVINWFANVQTTETGAALISSVAANTKAIGNKGTAAVLYTYEEYKALDGNDAVTEEEFTALSNATKTKTAAVPGTGLYKEIEDAIAASDAAINGLDLTDTAEDGKYVSSVSQENGKITVTRAYLPTLSVDNNSTSYAYVNNHIIEIKTTSLGTAVGLTQATEADEEKGIKIGDWVAANGELAENPGLATAADIAAEIVKDEKVIAQVLNNHEDRISANETAIGTANTAGDGETSNATGLYKEIEDAIAASNSAIEGLVGSGTLKDAKNNISFSYTQTDGLVTISDLVAYYTTTSYSDATDGTAYYSIAEGTGSYIATGNDIAYAVAYVNANISYISSWEIYGE